MWIVAPVEKLESQIQIPVKFVTFTYVGEGMNPSPPFHLWANNRTNLVL